MNQIFLRSRNCHKIIGGEAQSAFTEAVKLASLGNDIFSTQKDRRDHFHSMQKHQGHNERPTKSLSLNAKTLMNLMKDRHSSNNTDMEISRISGDREKCKLQVKI